MNDIRNVAGESVRIWVILTSKLHGWAEDGVAILPNVIVAAVVMVGFHYAAKGASAVIGRLLARSSETPAVTKLVQNFAQIMILFLGLFTALGVMNLEKTVGSLLAGAGVIGLAIGFAFQEIAANFFSGILIAFRKPFKPGDIVQVDSFTGTVRDLTLRTTNILTAAGLEVLIPNKNMFTKPVTNFTSVPGRRIEIECGVAYDSDLEKVEKVVKAALQNLPGRQMEKPIEFYFVSFGDSAINFKAFIWVGYPENNYFQSGTHLAIVAIQQAFAANSISIPYPTRTVLG